MFNRNGNLVLTSNNKILWQTDTAGERTTVFFDYDGNLLVIKRDSYYIRDFRDIQVIWSSNTQNRGEYMIIEDDGNLVIYDVKGEPVWATNTKQCINFVVLNRLKFLYSLNLFFFFMFVCLFLFQVDLLSKSGQLYKGQYVVSRNRRFKAILQFDGNFVLYANETEALWSSNTTDRGHRVILQRDGNLIIYDELNNPLWTSSTQSQGDYLMCQDDGNMVVMTATNKQVWSSNTTQSK